jgi:perosamine synthetase
MYEDLINFIQNLYKTEDFIPLHRPFFEGNEKKYLNEAIDSTFVSSVGPSVNEFESKVAEYTGIKYAVAVVNGTAALHLSLKISGAEENTEVITQSLTFVATCNAIKYCGADPVFVDVSKTTASLDSISLKEFLLENCEIRDDGFCWNKISEKKIVACLPMHTFGLCADLDEIKKVCDEFNIILVEDAAESLGSLYKNKHTGSIGQVSALSFNGNKIITTGSGGMILTNNEEIASKARHISTTSKVKHQWDFNHDEVGFNYRLPNLNAALGIAQLESIDKYIKNKRWIANRYQEWGDRNNINFLKESDECHSNYWLNALVADSKIQKEELLKKTNKKNIMTRPAWIPMHKLEIYKNYLRADLQNTNWLFDRIVCLPSSVNNAK